MIVLVCEQTEQLRRLIDSLRLAVARSSGRLPSYVTRSLPLQTLGTTSQCTIHDRTSESAMANLKEGRAKTMPSDRSGSDPP